MAAHEHDDHEWRIGSLEGRMDRVEGQQAADGRVIAKIMGGLIVMSVLVPTVTAILVAAINLWMRH